MQIVSYNYDCIWGVPYFDVPKLHIFEIVLLIKKWLKDILLSHIKEIELQASGLNNSVQLRL